MHRKLGDMLRCYGRTGWWVSLLVGFVLGLMTSAAMAYPKVQRIETSVGVELWLMQDSTLPVVSWQLLFRHAGSLSDGEQAGRAMVAAEAAMEGAGPYDAKQFHEALEDKAIGLSVSAGMEDVEASAYSLAEDTDIALQMLVLALSQPRLEDEALAKIREQLATARRQKQQSAMTQAVRNFWEKGFAGTPLAQDPLGVEETVEALDAKTLHDYRQAYWVRDRVLVAVAGDITPEKAKALVEKELLALPAQAAGAAVTVTEAQKLWPAGASYQHTMPSEQSAIWFALPAVSRQHKDFYALYVLNHILGGGGFASRLMQEVRVKQGLVYGVNTGLMERDTLALLVGNMQTRPGNEAKAIQAVRKVLAELAQGSITQAMRDTAVSHIVGRLPLQMASVSALSGFMLVMQRYELGADYIDQRQRLFEAVTLADLQRVASTYLQPAALVVSTAGKPGEATK